MKETILSISGKPGLFRLLAQGNGNLILETLDETKKRVPAGNRDRVTSLRDVSMYTLDEDMPLMQVFENMKQKEISVIFASSHSATIQLKKQEKLFQK
jgi:dephospho-CoA kinase